MEKTRLLIDARVVGGEGQGSATYIKGLYNAMYHNYQDKYELYFASYEYKPLKAAFPFLEQSHFIQIKSKSRFKIYFSEFPKIIDAYKIDFGHFQYIVPFRKRCKNIVTVHDVLFNDFPEEFSYLYRWRRNYLFKRSLKQSEIKLTVSEYSRSMIGKSYQLNPAEILITPNAIAEEFIKPYDKVNAEMNIFKQYSIKNFILFVSRIEPRKNHKMLIEAYAKLALHQQGIQLVIIGNDTHHSQIIENALAKLDHSCRESIHWIKYVSDHDLIEFYRASKLFVYPSKAEGFGIPPIEAAAVGINTLCSNTTSMRDFYFFGENHFSPNDLNSLVKKLQENIENPPSAEHLKKIRDIIIEKYSWEKGAKLIHEQIQVHMKNFVNSTEEVDR
jgi:glycosyltransferase involved in cell wall biosynthesis